MMPFGNMEMMDFLSKGGFDQSKAQSPQDVLKMLHFAKLFSKAQELDLENQKEDSRKL